MRTFHEALAGVEVYSPSEELFNRRRRTAGLTMMRYGVVLDSVAFAVIVSLVLLLAPIVI